MACFICPFSNERRCDGPCGLCPEGQCVIDRLETPGGELPYKPKIEGGKSGPGSES